MQSSTLELLLNLGAILGGLFSLSVLLPVWRLLDGEEGDDAGVPTRVGKNKHTILKCKTLNLFYPGAHGAALARRCTEACAGTPTVQVPEQLGRAGPARLPGPLESRSTQHFAPRVQDMFCLICSASARDTSFAIIVRKAQLK